MKAKLYFLIVLVIFSALFHQDSNSQVWWDECNTGVTVSLNSVHNLDGEVAWVCGDNGTVLRTTNYGYNWSNLGGGGLPSNITLVNIFVSSTTTALVAGYTGSNTYVYRTVISGGAWTQVFSQANGFINAIWMTSNTEGFMQGNPVGGRWSLWKTTNGGVNWDSTGLYLPQAGSETGWKNSLWVSGSRIWFGTNNSRIYYSSNNGATWSTQTTAPVTNTFTVWTDTIQAPIGFAGGSSLLKTTNQGLNWNVVSSLGSGNINGFTGRGYYYYYFWYIRSNNNIYNSNTGSQWYIEYTAPSGNYTHISRSPEVFWGPCELYAVRDNGGISRGNFIIDNIKLISSEVPSAYKLYQNYPNPFNSTTKFKFDTRILPHSKTGEIRGGHVKLILYNLLGQEIDILVDKVVQPGLYEADWQGNSNPSGIYFYRLLITDPNSSDIVFNEIRKMVMVK